MAVSGGCTPGTLCKCLRQTEIDAGRYGGLTSYDGPRIKEPERENREVRRAKEVPRTASPFLAQAELDRPRITMTSLIDQQRIHYGLELICPVLLIPPSTHYVQKAPQPDLSRLSECARCDALLSNEIDRAWHENRESYASRKVRKQLRREDAPAPRSKVERLLHKLDLRGVVCGCKPSTPIPDDVAALPSDLVQRGFTTAHRNQLPVADPTYVATWLHFMCAAIFIDAPRVSFRRWDLIAIGIGW